MKKPDFLHIDDTNSSKLKVIEKCWCGRGHKCLCSL